MGIVDPFSGSGNEKKNEKKKQTNEVKDDSVSIGSSEFVKIKRNGRTEYRRKGYEDDEFPPPEPRTVMELRAEQAERRAKKTKKSNGRN